MDSGLLAFRQYGYFVVELYHLERNHQGLGNRLIVPITPGTLDATMRRFLRRSTFNFGRRRSYVKRCPKCQGQYQNSVSFCPRDKTALVAVSTVFPGAIVCRKYRIIEMLGAGGMGTVYL